VAKNSNGTTETDSGHDVFAGTKGRPTPTRKEKEALRKRPLVSSDRSVARLQARTADQQAREKARIGMAKGDERYLPIRDRGAQRRYIRDYIDARLNFGEFLIPVMIIVLILTLIPFNTDVQVVAMLTLYLFLLLAVIDAVVVSFIIRRRLRAKFGAEKLERGAAFYSAMRGFQLRVLRLPKPQVKRGEYPE
jgi:Protein of unknown function (DUF3043)